MICEQTQQQLEQLADPNQLETLEDDERRHLASCDDCTTHHALLRTLAVESASAVAPALSPQLLAAVERRTLHALRATQSNRALHRDIAAPLAVALLALPVALVQGWLWLKGTTLLLGSWLPTSILTGMAVVHFTSVALVLGALYAAIPLVIAYATPIRQEAS